jgi:hypothetical protein
MDKLRRPYQLGEAALRAQSRWYKLYDFNFFFSDCLLLTQSAHRTSEICRCNGGSHPDGPKANNFKWHKHIPDTSMDNANMQAYKRFRQFPEPWHRIYNTYDCLHSLHNRLHGANSLWKCPHHFLLWHPEVHHMVFTKTRHYPCPKSVESSPLSIILFELYLLE